MLFRTHIMSFLHSKAFATHCVQSLTWPLVNYVALFMLPFLFFSLKPNSAECLTTLTNLSWILQSRVPHTKRSLRLFQWIELKGIWGQNTAVSDNRQLGFKTGFIHILLNTTLFSESYNKSYTRHMGVIWVRCIHTNLSVYQSIYPYIHLFSML